MNVFKTYDIRGIYPDEINEKLFYNLGLRVRKLGIKEIAVGRDARLSSNILFNAFASGLMDSGINVIDLGVLTSPMLSYFCAAKKKKGAMITASHNPKEYNGLKFVDEKGIQLSYDTILKKLKNLMTKKAKISDKKGKSTSLDILGGYHKNLVNRLKVFIKEIKVVFDCSNGVGGIPLLSIVPNLNISSIIINEKPDGHFPNHGPDQTNASNLRQLQNEVLRSKSDIGIMFDGDADRCAFVDEKGRIVPLDLAFLILALDVTRNSRIQDPKIVYDLRFSRSVAEVLEENGIRPIIMRVGNPFHKTYLHRDKKALLAGELSGHIMYSENYGIDDALFASLKMIELISKSDLKLSEMVDQYKKYKSTGEISIVVQNAKKSLKIIEKKYTNEKKIFIDGISVLKKDVWFNIRSSNTEPLIRFEIEGIDEKVVDRQKEEIIKLLKNKIRSK